MLVLGWASGLLLAFCGLPQAVHAYRNKHSKGISWSFIYMWWIGEAFGLAFAWSLGSAPLIFNYGINMLFTSIILYYKLWPTTK